MADDKAASSKPSAPVVKPSATGGKLTRSQAARLAALARWGKYKGKGKPKGGSGKPKATPESREAEKRQAAQANRAKVMGEMGVSPEDVAAMDALAMGQQPENADALIAAGIVERGKDGTIRFTASGRVAYNAASRGDAGAAGDALSRAKDKAPKGEAEAAAEEEKPKGGGGGGGSKKPTDDEKRTEAERKKAQAARQTAQALPPDERLTEAGVGALEAAVNGTLDGAATPVLTRLGLVDADGNATDQGRRALSALQRGNVGQYRAAVQDAQARMEREAARAARTQKGLPMDGVIEHLTAAVALLDSVEPDATKAGRRNSTADQALIDAAYGQACALCDLLEALGAVGDAEDEEEEGESDDEPSDAMMLAGAVKMLGEDRVGGYAVRFGSADEPDLSAFRDYFTKATDFWLDAWQTRPMLYHHAMDAATKDAPVVGRWTSARIDDVGVWLEGQLDMAHRYAAAVKDLVRRGVLKLSSDSAPHLVVRAPGPNNTHEVKRWPLLAASLTPSPAEPRLLPVGALKAAFDAAGILPPAELIDSPEADDAEAAEVADATKAAQDERARRLTLELSLIALETA